ncbi:hypothetical protein [Thermococcus camini]|uniref:CRISPR-associated protein n=1 Tax=Thermococcus camini TaxID=2016373 RepID=A0A7G2D6F3_9EURY|nr:hypothetical protein [Thermococcus camini]CAD5243990.1 conserved protein of unknown function [Thermococcus camini]
MKIAYITLLGRSEWALVNTYYAVVSRGSKPDRVFIFTEETYRKKLPRVVEALKAISRAYNFTPEIEAIIIPDNSFLEADRKFKELFQRLEREGYTIDLDITSGRKALATAAVVQLREFPVEGIIYMALLDMDFPDRPYMMIPIHMQRLKNFLGDKDAVSY